MKKHKTLIIFSLLASGIFFCMMIVGMATNNQWLTNASILLMLLCYAISLPSRYIVDNGGKGNG